MEDYYNVELDPFDVDNISINSRIFVVGKTESGKSTKVKWIMKSLGQRIRKGFVMTGSVSADYDYVPPLYIHEGFNEQVLKDVFLIQDLKNVECEFDPTINPNMWAIFDDLSDKKAAMKSEMLKAFFSRGRHRHITTMLMAQYFRELPKDLRPNVDYLILLKNKSSLDRQDIFKQFVSCCDFKTFNQIFDQCTERKGALVYHANAEKNDPRSCFFYLRIPDTEFVPDPKHEGKWKLPEFDMGCQKYRDYSVRHYHNEVRERTEAAARAKVQKRRRNERKRERLRKIAAGELDTRKYVSTIGSDYKSSVVTSNSALHSEPVMAGERRGGCGGGLMHGLDTFSNFDGEGGDDMMMYEERRLPDPSSHSF